jgi:hypothetical protein
MEGLPKRSSAGGPAAVPYPLGAYNLRELLFKARLYRRTGLSAAAVSRGAEVGVMQLGILTGVTGRTLSWAGTGK